MLICLANRARKAVDMSESKAGGEEKKNDTRMAESTESGLTAETRYVSAPEPFESLQTIEANNTLASSETERGVSKTQVSVQPANGAPRSPVENVTQFSKQRYRTYQELGSGGMGVVKLADDLLIQRQVAVKTLREGDSEKAREGFLRESRVQGRLQHPNIVTVYDAGVLESGELAIVMQYIRGRNLSDILNSLRAMNVADHRRFPLEARLDIFAAVVNALSYAHGENLIHCDVKPANVIVGDHGEVWLADWGIARAIPGAGPHASAATKSGSVPLDTGTIKEGAVFGTPRYMSHEQASGTVRLIDPRSDIYSAFVLLFELVTLTDWIPSGLTLQDTIEAAKKRTPPSISDAVFDHDGQDAVPTELRYFLQKGLASDQDKRFDDCDEVLRELLRIRNGKFAIRCPITLVKRLQNSLSHAIDRRPQLVIFALLFLLAVWVLGVVGGVMYAFA
ncbi:MAG: hypothetical protein CBD74_12400 [Saprospirales bacterium TMED214]|nr:MAG: hypothetical protein CBD74_12400 [Saprospirales bacterium TMED214]